MNTESNQDRLKKLEQTEKQARERARRYLEKQAALGKKQISGLVDQETYNLLIQYRENTGLSIGGALDIMIESFFRSKPDDRDDGDTTETLTPADTADLSPEAIEHVISDEPEPLTPALDALVETSLDTVLLNLVEDTPGMPWSKRADLLNDRGIKTARRKNWTGDNLRIACKRISK